MQWIRAAVQTVRRNGLDAGQTVKRACTGPGRERDLAVQAVKAAMAAWIAWAVAGWWLEAPVAFVAPWVAIVLVESTVYRSVAHGLQQLAAIASGTVAATAVALLLHDRMVAMALVLPCAVLLGQWRRLGSQGIYAATGALFVLTNPSVSIAASTARITEALFGAVVGIAVNALIRPPLYLRDTRAVLRDATHEAHDILEAVADGLADGRWDTDEADTWHARALRLQRLVDQARAAVGHSRESLRINIRSRTGTSGTASPPGKEYDDAVLVLEYAAVHTAGVTRTVLEAAAEDQAVTRPESALTRRYADFLRQTAHALRLYSHSRFSRQDDQELRQAVQELRRTLDALRHHLSQARPDAPGEVAVNGALLTQAHRLAGQLVTSET
ncbi:FUSC family protein [Streptomyces sp. NBC_00582]|uniref:FUSC family protein n=1 Tax=Streptomyces sp. NBC_00582 TaxID=2975783 RepID=UPI0010645DE4|nr:aromatic acid exporter family protein [Streptomyces sp. NBC_00582]WUB67016.1 aromatic acid exporter family protein [Streptomyces sp. NBC_00582]